MNIEYVEIKTKPCPFCGCEDIMLQHSWFDSEGRFDLFAVVCQNDECCAHMGSKSSIGDAVKAWERRVVETAEERYLVGKHDQD